MELRDFLLAMFNALPEKQIAGKKRLQKIVHLMKEAGADVNTDYRILHYGPFSSEVADAVDELSIFGEIYEKTEPVGFNSIFQYVYSLGNEPQDVANLSDNFKNVLEKLDNCSTVVLEVASTIAFFESQGLTRDKAIEETEYLKPTKTIEPVLRKAENVLEHVEKSRKNIHSKL